MGRNFLGALPYFISGADQGDDYLGATSYRGRGYGYYGSNMTRAATDRGNRAAQFVRPDIAGVPQRDAALLPAAFPAFSFALATGTNTIQQTANPQTPFRGQRLSAVIIRNGTSAATTAPLMSQFIIGQKPIITTGSGVPLETFNQSAFDTNLLMPPTVPGVIYTMNINLVAALTTTDTLLALVSIIGSAVL
jgi:hypothetical protein